MREVLLNHLEKGIHGFGESVLPLSVVRDCQIRQAMNDAVRHDDVQVGEITKELQHQKGLLLLHAISAERPFRMPDACAGDDPRTLGSDNAVMRLFAFDAYDALDEYFGGGRWGRWLIAPYFTTGDDSWDSFYIGVFAEDFAHTVVE